MNFFKFCLRCSGVIFFLEAILGFEVSIFIFMLGLAVIVR